MGKKNTIEDFINKARKIHGDKYDYSKVNYKNVKTPICIVCPIHGEFPQRPNNHLSGQGCPDCGEINRRKTQTKSFESFLTKAREVHGDKYDYSKAELEYKDRTTKVHIICPIHGEFPQQPNNHLSGQECPECGYIKRANSNRFSTEDFINKAREVHGDKYDYSKVEYVGTETPVCIICPIHGEFPQTPHSHLAGQGCPDCGLEKQILQQTYTTEDFINKAREVHGDKYDYSKVNYKKSREKVIIICPIHGEFPQEPASHLSGQGCPDCGEINRIKNTTKPLESFLDEARKVHGYKYDYSKVRYVNSKTPVCIICPIHGEFPQTPNCHISQKQGCPYCKESKLEKSIATYLTNNKIKYKRQEKRPWLKYKGSLSLDFYLPEYNVAIECQGEQHFMTCDYFGGESGYNHRKKLDKIKYDLCAEHGIKIFYYSDLGIEYPYHVYEDVDEMITDIKQYSINCLEKTMCEVITK